MAKPCADVVRRLCSQKTFAALLTIALLLTSLSHDASSAIYRYTNKDGVVTFTDDIKKVPPAYKNKITVIEETAPQATTSRPVLDTVQPTLSPSQQESGQKPPVVDKDTSSLIGGLLDGLPARIIAGIAVSAALLIGLRRLFAALGLKRLGALIWVAITCLVFVYLMGEQIKKSAEYLTSMKRETNLIQMKLDKKEQDSLKTLEDPPPQK